jgi:DNA-directed RNA polymerase II subunit RPB1
MPTKNEFSPSPRLNLSATSPYNADFDGDEMNLHLAQSHETRAEIKYIMLVPRQMVSPQGNKPVMGVVQDSLLAISKFTRRDTLLRKDLAFNLMMTLPAWDGVLPVPCILKPEPMWSGKQIFSLLLKDKITLQKDTGISSKNKEDLNRNFTKADHRVIIRNGELVQGVICKKNVGSSSGGIIHLTWLDYGPEACKVFISYIQKLANAWLLHHSFTVGCQDIVADTGTMLKVAEALQEAKNDVADIMVDAQRGLLETQPGELRK